MFTGDGPPTRLDTVLAGRTAVLTARHPGAALVDHCRRNGLALVRVSSTPGRPAADPDAGWTEVRLADPGRASALRALTANPGLAVIVRPDRAIAAVESGYRLPPLPWHIPATSGPGPAAAARPPAQTDHNPLPTTR